MADERPEKSNGKGGSGPSDPGHGRRGGRRRGFRGRHGGARDGARDGAAGRNLPGEASSAGISEDQARSTEQQGRDGQPKPREQRQPRPEEISRQEAARDMPACPLCGKPVYDLSTAITAARETGDPAHFDCVLERVAASEPLASGEKLVYLGSGAFGVVEFKDKSESHFTVKRRIQWEKEGEKKDWRKGLSSRIANL
jgi:hypothetical protein